MRRRLLGRREPGAGLLVAPRAAPAAVAAVAAERGEDVAAAPLPRDGGGEVGPFVEQHAARAGQRCRDLVRRDADAVGHDGLQLADAQMRGVRSWSVGGSSVVFFFFFFGVGVILMRCSSLQQREPLDQV